MSRNNSPQSDDENNEEMKSPKRNLTGSLE